MWRKSLLSYSCIFAMTLQVWHLIVWILEQWEVWLWRISVGKTGKKACRSIRLLEVCQHQQQTHNSRFPVAIWIVWLSDCGFSQKTFWLFIYTTMVFWGLGLGLGVLKWKCLLKITPLSSLCELQKWEFVKTVMSCEYAVHVQSIGMYLTAKTNKWHGMLNANF